MGDFATTAKLARWPRCIAAPSRLSINEVHMGQGCFICGLNM